MTEQLVGVPGAMVATTWPKAWPLLEPSVALWGGRFDEPTLRAKVDSGDVRLFIALDGGRPIAACLASVSAWPTGVREATVDVVGGQGVGRWAGRMREIEAWARQNDCRFLACKGRNGWRRVLEPAGFAFDSTVLVKDLSNDGCRLTAPTAGKPQKCEAPARPLAV